MINIDNEYPEASRCQCGRIKLTKYPKCYYCHCNGDSWADFITIEHILHEATREDLESYKRLIDQELAR